MVQTDISQLSAECKDWRQILRSYREEFNDSKKYLQEICRKSLSKDQLLQIEHFDNQFHIQLINIHDLKQQIKGHEQKIQEETAENENVSDAIFAHHEELLEQFVGLENTLQDLRDEFKNFVSTTNS